MCTFGVLGLLCETLAASGPPRSCETPFYPPDWPDQDIVLYYNYNYYYYLIIIIMTSEVGVNGFLSHSSRVGVWALLFFFDTAHLPRDITRKVRSLEKSGGLPHNFTN